MSVITFYIIEFPYILSSTDSMIVTDYVLRYATMQLLVSHTKINSPNMRHNVELLAHGLECPGHP